MEGRGDLRLVSAGPFLKRKNDVGAVFGRTEEESIKEEIGSTYTSSSLMAWKVFVAGQILKDSVSQMAMSKCVDGWPYIGQNICLIHLGFYILFQNWCSVESQN